jgi:Outer membrane protein beta-barrel domain
MSIKSAAFFMVLLVGLAASALAQERPSPAAEFQSGWVGFVDETPVHHALFGGAARIYLTPRLAVGPEIDYLRGPRTDRDLFATGNLTFDVRRPRNGQPPRVSPFVVAGAGLGRHSFRFGTLDYSHTEGAFTGGGGVRVWVTDRLYAAAEARFGWELHMRISGAVGVTLD